MTTTTTTTDQRPTCSVCHGHDVETTAWVSYTADGVAHVVDGEGPGSTELGNWCHDCQEHVYLDYPTTTPADDAARQAANAARDHAGELVQLLAALVADGPADTLETFDPAARLAVVARARQLLADLAR